MVTNDVAAKFFKDYADLDEQDKARFKEAVSQFVEDLKAGQGFRPGLRVKRVQGTRDIFEMTWAPDGRATWQYGESIDGEAHVIWRRVGTHDIFKSA